MPRIILFALFLGLVGCSADRHNVYYWGDYPSQVYVYLKNEADPEKQIAILQENAERARAQNRPLPPGFYGHLGLLYGKVGQTDRMREAFETEKRLYPDSKEFMDFLLKTAEEKKAG